MTTNNIKEVVNLPEWQELRKSLVGTWKETPINNVLKLREFLGDMTCPRRLRIIHNYLTGTAFRIGRIRHDAITDLLNEVRELRK